MTGMLDARLSLNNEMDRFKRLEGRSRKGPILHEDSGQGNP